MSGKLGPGTRLPTYDALMEQFRVTRPTVARVVALLRDEGLVTDRGERSLFVAQTFPHHRRYLWVTSEQPGSVEWTGFLETILEVIKAGETGIPGDFVPLVGVDGRANNPAYKMLCDVVEQGSAAGLLLMNSATVYLLPVVQEANLPRAAIWSPLPHSGLVRLDFVGLIERACARLVEKGKRIAVVSPHAANLVAAEECLLRLGVEKKQLWTLHVGPIGSEHVAELLFSRSGAPEALFITDDNLVEPMLTGLQHAGARPGDNVYVLAHCNWPHPFGLGSGVEHIGFDVREVLGTAKQCIDAQRAGEPAPTLLVRPRFIDELTQPLKQPATA